MNILVISPSVSAYDVLLHFSEQVFYALRKHKNNVFYFKPNPSGFLASDLREICINYSISHVFSFNAVGFQLMQNIDLEHINNIGWLVDYPAHHFSRLNCNLQSSHVISSNPLHKHYVNEITNTNYGQALNIGVNNFDSTIPNILNRDFDIVFVGSWMGAPENFWDPIQNSKIRNLSKKALEILISDDKSDSYTVVKHLLIESDINPNNNIKLINALILFLEDFTRKYQRLKLMNAAAISGLKTLVVGTGWSGHFAGSNLFFHEPVSNEDMNQIYRKCKMVICLNSNNGACERALQALSNGCSVFSFDGLPMDDLKLNTNGIFTTSSIKSDFVIKKEMIDWYENFIYDCNDQISINKIFENYSWDKVSEKLLNILINCENSSYTSLIDPRSATLIN